MPRLRQGPLLMAQSGPVVIVNEWGPIPSYHIRLGDPLMAGRIGNRVLSGKESDAVGAVESARLVIVQRGYGARARFCMR